MNDLDINAINYHSPYIVGYDGKPIREYIALIVQRSHPQLNEISLFFEEELQMFNENKP